MQQASGQEGLIFTRADLRADELRAGRQDSSVFLVQIHAGHGCHVVDVIIISALEGAEQRCQMPVTEEVNVLYLYLICYSPEGPASRVTQLLLIGLSCQVNRTFTDDSSGSSYERT